MITIGIKKGRRKSCPKYVRTCSSSCLCISSCMASQDAFITETSRFISGILDSLGIRKTLKNTRTCMGPAEIPKSSISSEVISVRSWIRNSLIINNFQLVPSRQTVKPVGVVNEELKWDVLCCWPKKSMGVERHRLGRVKWRLKTMKSLHTFYISLSSLNQRQSIFDLRRTRVTGSTTSQGATVVLFGPAAFSIENENCQEQPVLLYLCNFFLYFRWRVISVFPSFRSGAL